MSSQPAAEDQTGAGLVNASFAGTGTLLVAGALGAASPDRLGALTAVVSGVLFAVGVVALLYGYAAGVVRSQDEDVTLAGLFFLSQTAPELIRFRLRIALVAQIAIAVIVAVLRPYTAVAFVVLAPMFGLGLMATWGARYGVFQPKTSPGDRRR